MKRISLLLLFCLLACSRQENLQVADMTVQPEEFVIDIAAKGTLKAVKATPISVPSGIRGSLTVAWFVEEGATVAEGAEIIRFDGYSIQLQEEDTQGEILQLDYEISIKDQDNLKTGRNLDKDLNLTQLERTQAARFAPRDERLFSRAEIIDSQVNLDFLDTKVDHYEVKIDRHDHKASSDQQLLVLRQDTHRLKLEQLTEAKTQLVILAPHPGLFYLEDTWQGKPRVGMTAWGGMKLGQLPDLSEMEAKVYVLEMEAMGLEEGLEVSLRLDSDPAREHQGSVKSIDALAKALEKDSPVKYFEVIISLNHTDPQIMRPGSLVNARIFVAREQDVLTVPNQALFHEDGRTWLHVKQGQHYAARDVTLGKRGATRTVISSGLKPGEQVALSKPKEAQP